MTHIVEVLANIIMDNFDLYEDILLKSKYLDIPYLSADLRCSSFKLAPVDINVFPAGFNNFLNTSLSHIPNIIKDIIHNDIKNVMIIAEDHTRNINYFKCLKVLQDIFIKSGLKVVICNFIFEEKKIIALNDKEEIVINALRRMGNNIESDDGFRPDLIFMHNDLTAGIPDILRDIDQKIIPHVSMGWHSRKKYDSLKCYGKVASDISDKLSIDPWLISSFVEYCEDVDFKSPESMSIIHEKVILTFDKIRDKYRKYNIKEDPYVFIKANNGTYGMGITAVKSPDEVLSFNKNIRKNMNRVKGNVSVTDVVIQEGIYSEDKVDSFSAEPVIYSMFGSYLGSFFRYHENYLYDQSLNRPGAKFTDLNAELSDSSRLVYTLFSALVNKSVDKEISSLLHR